MEYCLWFLILRIILFQNLHLSIGFQQERFKRSNIPCGTSFTPCSRNPDDNFLNDGFKSENFLKEKTTKSSFRLTDGDHPVDQRKVISSAFDAKQDVDNLFNRTERSIFAEKKVVYSSTSEIWADLNKIDAHAKQLSYSSLISIGTTKRLLDENRNLNNALALTNLIGTVLDEICPINFIKNCESSKYRSYSGHCNNVNNPLWGAVYEPMQRLIKPDYADGVDSPRVASIGGPLPSARKLSLKLFSTSHENHVCTLMVAQWAMFIYEDLVSVGSNRAFKGDESRALPCCEREHEHPECYPIRTDDEDVNKRCISYTRSSTAPRENCSLGSREQGNQVTSYLDGSQIYGSTEHKTKQLRSFRRGYLNFQSRGSNSELLPEGLQVFCLSRSSTRPCFLSGSEYTNLLPTSTAMHTVWMRFHNSIADKLEKLNPHWEDERLYEEARRIVIASVQHITYNEFLPIIVGRDSLRLHGLNLRQYAYDSDYDMNIDATVLNEFASAAGLFFFTLFPDHISLYNADYKKESQKPLNALFVDPSIVYGRERIEAIMRYLLRESIRKPGLHMDEQFRNDFLRKTDSSGLDLAAIIIQMGRDHGIPSYTTYRSYCGLPRPSDFAELADIVLDEVNISEISQVYSSIDDVDLFVLGLAEKPLRGALVGPTFSCILGRQFQRTRRGDRFWYENFFVPSAFTLEQLNEIRKISLARVICDSSKNLGAIQPGAFQVADEYGNCPMECDSKIIDTPDFTKWLDQEPRLKIPITKSTLEKAIRLGAEHAKRLNDAEAARISKQGRSRSRSSAIVTHSDLMAPKNESLKLSRTAAILRETTKVLVGGNGLEERERLPSQLDIKTLQRLLPEIDVSKFVGNITDFLGHENPREEECLPKPLPCDHTTKYRTFSGWCNNLRFPHYGNAFAPMRRLLDPVYDDGFDSPRIIGRNGRKLPSARVISNAVHHEARLFHTKFTHMLMQFGQLIDHDFAHSPVSRGPGNTILNCSRCDSTKTLSIHCFPIPIERGDPHFPHLTENGEPRCISFVRSLLGQLTLGYRNQLNQLTSFIDASFIYGSTECEANSLRLFSQGRLNFTDLGFNKEALPQGSQERDCRSRPRHPCFNAGDERSNEQPGLTVMHTIFLREHNRIATTLNRINNFWTDEKLYLETRRIIGAKVQHILYNEWLPIILGCEVTAKYDLVPRKTGYYTGYDQRCDATTSQEMATAAFRFGHTLIRNTFSRMNSEYAEQSRDLDLKDSFNNETFYYQAEEGHIESVLMGLLGVPSMAFDRHISDAIRNHLFQKPGGPHTGLDLPALNIQRSRDHGVQPYNAYREMCKLGRAHNFDDLLDVMDESAVNALRSVYHHVDDIDLFAGLMSERPLKGALVGPTIACILGEQFQRFKRCDRFYYENDDPATKFTPGQLAEIRKTTFSKVLCVNSQYAHRIQPNAFLMPDDLTNAPVKCTELDDLDLFEWLDRQFCVVDHRVINLGKTKRITPCITCTCTTEGPECHSMVIDRCDSLLNDYLFSEVIADTVCVIQCSKLIKQRAGRL